MLPYIPYFSFKAQLDLIFKVKFFFFPILCIVLLRKKKKVFIFPGKKLKKSY